MELEILLAVVLELAVGIAAVAVVVLRILPAVVVRAVVHCLELETDV